MNFGRLFSSFSEVLAALKAWKRASRAGWPIGMEIFLVNGSTFQVSRAPLNKIFTEGTSVDYQPHIDILIPSEVSKTKKVQVWTPAMEDILAEDWDILS